MLYKFYQMYLLIWRSLYFFSIFVYIYVIYDTFLIHIHCVCMFVCVVASCIFYIGQFLRKKQNQPYDTLHLFTCSLVLNSYINYLGIIQY